MLSPGKKTLLSSSLRTFSPLNSGQLFSSKLFLTFTSLVRPEHWDLIMSPPVVDEKAKEHLILCKNIRQATSKILQRPSYFQGSRTRLDQLKPKSGEKRKTESTRPKSVKDSTLERNFEFALRSNVNSNKSYSEYEYEFEKLHKNQQRNNCYEEIGEVRPYQPNR